MNDLTIFNGTVIPITARGCVLAPGYLVIKDGAISRIGAGAPPSSSETAQRIDACGGVVMPGLTNAHTHLYQVLFRAVWEGRHSSSG